MPPRHALCKGIVYLYLNPVKDVILVKHIAMVRRVFAQLPDPPPDDPKAIVKAFRNDPGFSAPDFAAVSRTAGWEAISTGFRTDI